MCIVTFVPPIFPNHRDKSTYRPRIVKMRKSTGLDNTAGDTGASGYAIGEDGVGSLYHDQKHSSSSEGGIVQNMTGEARGKDMGSFGFQKGCSCSSDYITENTGRPNNLGIQSQDNCMHSHCSRHPVPSSIELDSLQFLKMMKSNTS